MPYIDRDALIERLTRMWESRQLTNTKYKSFTEILTAESTADVVEVVRCKDCKHRDPEDKKCDNGHFIQWQLPRDDDWFCADGERRDDAEIH